MKNCLVCGDKFAFRDRIKSIFKHPFEIRLKCSQCGTVYKTKRTIHRFVYYFIVFVIFSNLQNIFQILIKGYERNIAVSIMQIIACIIFLLLYDLVGHKYQKYEILK